MLREISRGGGESLQGAHAFIPRSSAVFYGERSNHSLGEKVAALFVFARSFLLMGLKKIVKKKRIESSKRIVSVQLTVVTTGCIVDPERSEGG